MLIPEIRAMPYPCRCLWRGFEQMISTARWRRMTLHFSHIGLTDGRTFMKPFGGTSRKEGRERAGALAARPARLANDSVRPGDYAALAARLATCQGVRIFGPSAVMATVNSKWAASEPSC